MDLLQLFEWLREGLRWLLASAITLFVTTVLVLMHADSGTAGILYLVLVVWAATLAGRAVSIYLAIIVSFLFDYYLDCPVFNPGWR